MYNGGELPDCCALHREAVAFVPSTNTTSISIPCWNCRPKSAGRTWPNCWGASSWKAYRWRTTWSSRIGCWLSGSGGRGAPKRPDAPVAGDKRRGLYSEALRHALRSPSSRPGTMRSPGGDALVSVTGQRGAALRQFELSKEVMWEELVLSRPKRHRTILDLCGGVGCAAPAASLSHSRRGQA